MSDVVEKQPLTEDYLKKMDAYWRAANYIAGYSAGAEGK